MSRNFEYRTLTTSRSLQGGISYTSAWLPGVGVSGAVSLTPHVSLEADYAQYHFTTTQIIYNLFDQNDLRPLSGEQRVGSVSLAVGHVMKAKGKSHRVSASLGWSMSQHKITSNNEYNGFNAHTALFQVAGQLTLRERQSWIELKARLNPIVSLGESVRELGASAESVGFGFELGIARRATSGLTIKLAFSLDDLTHSPSGVGRGGREGSEASDQLSQVKLALGWVGGG